MLGMSDFFTNHDLMNTYIEIKNIYNIDSNKDQNKYLILKAITNCFSKINTTETISRNLYKLKVLMETQFIRDVKCQYNYLITPEQCGCDLRELIFNYETDENRKALISNINIASKEMIKDASPIPHILTDIDDTIFPNYNGPIETAGSDTSWATQKLYPGIAKFYEHFYKTLPIKEARYSTILSGTPIFLKNMRLHNSKIQTALGPNYGFLHGFDSKRQALHALLVGMTERPPYNFAVSSTHLAEIKFNKFIQYKQLFPEYKMLVIGDNGQGDLAAGLKIIQSDSSAHIFIHNILRRKTNFIFSDDDELKFKHDRLFFFKNYLELAAIFFKLNLFKFSDVSAIRTAIKSELEIQYITDKSPYLYSHFNSNLIPRVMRISMTNRFTRKFTSSSRECTGQYRS